MLGYYNYLVQKMISLFYFFAERDGDELEGMLVRKHEWENTTKKASNR